MVAMAVNGPKVTMNHRLGVASERLIRTQLALLPPRLTRGGRMVGTGVSALLIGALSVGLATAAQATRTGSAPSARYVAKVAVPPGQSLWTLAQAYDPNADPRLVIQEIRQLNSLTGDQVQAGAVLWVPRG